jgi:hypothetical protein
LGKYIAYDLAKVGHERPVSEIRTQIQKNILRAANNFDAIDEFSSDGSPLFRIGGKGKEPDGKFSPKQLQIGGIVRDVGFGFPFPALVIEIALTHESLNELKSELLDWIGFHTSVQVAIGVKIFRQKVDGSRRIVGLLYRRNHAAIEIEFGSDVPIVSGLIMSFPITDLYVGVPLQIISNIIAPLLGNPPHEIVIDLERLHAEMLATL